MRFMGVKIIRIVLNCYDNTSWSQPRNSSITLSSNKLQNTCTSWSKSTKFPSKKEKRKKQQNLFY